MTGRQDIGMQLRALSSTKDKSRSSQANFWRTLLLEQCYIRAVKLFHTKSSNPDLLSSLCFIPSNILLEDFFHAFFTLLASFSDLFRIWSLCVFFLVFNNRQLVAWLYLCGVGKIMFPTPKRCPCSSLWNVCLCYVTLQEGIKAADGITIANWLTLKYYPGFCMWAQYNQMGPEMGKWETEEYEKNLTGSSGFGDWGDHNQETRAVSRSWKGKETDSSL